MTPAIGSPAPAFTLADQNGNLRSLSDFAGSWTVVYFYPKDDTPGCTAEACAFRDASAAFAEQGIAVVGISPDSVESHGRFAEKHRLDFVLLADPGRRAIGPYGAWGEKTLYGKRYEGVLRSSVLVAPDGTVAKVYPNVTPAGHAADILRDVAALTTGA